MKLTGNVVFENIWHVFFYSC